MAHCRYPKYVIHVKDLDLYFVCFMRRMQIVNSGPAMLHSAQNTPGRNGRTERLNEWFEENPQVIAWHRSQHGDAQGDNLATLKTTFELDSVIFYFTCFFFFPFLPYTPPLHRPSRKRK